MTREEARKILESGRSIKVYAWTFYKNQVECEEGCCNDGFKDIDEALDLMSRYGAFDDINKP